MEGGERVHVEVRDALFYIEDSSTEIWNLSDIAQNVFDQLEIEVYEKLPLDDSIQLKVDAENLDDLLGEYDWEVVDDKFIYVYLDGTICGSDASRVEISWALEEPPLKFVR